MKIKAHKGAYLAPDGDLIELRDGDRLIVRVRDDEMIELLANRHVTGKPVMWTTIGVWIVLWPRPDADADYQSTEVARV